MSDFTPSMKRYAQYFLYFIAIAVLGWGFTSYQTIFLGVILGTVLSFFILWSLFSKVKRLGQAIVEGRKMRSLGTLTRFALAALGVIAAIRYPELFSPVGVVIGLISTYIIIFLDFFIQKRFSSGKR